MQSSSPPIAFSRSGGPFSRIRAPSDPKTPDYRSHPDSGAFSPISIGSPSFGGSYSRPHSRTSSHPQQQFHTMDGVASRFDRHRSASPDMRNDPNGSSPHEWTPGRTGLMSPPPSDQSDSFDDDGYMRGINSLPIPSNGSDSDSDSGSDDDLALGLVHERTISVSTISLDLQERMEALQRVNDDLRRKLSDAEDTMQRKLAEHESDLENMQQRLEEMDAELSATKRQEKELRAKEVSARLRLSRRSKVDFHPFSGRTPLKSLRLRVRYPSSRRVWITRDKLMQTCNHSTRNSAVSILGLNRNATS